MAKLNAVNRYLFASFITAIILAASMYVILRPIEWRPHLLSLFSRSFNAFTQSFGTNGAGWMVSNVYSRVFLIIVPVALVGIASGIPAMRRYWTKTASIALLAVGGLIVPFGFVYLRTVTRTVYNDHQSLVSANSRLTRNSQDLAREISTWRSRALTAERSRAKSAATFPNESPKMATQNFRTLASDVLDFQDNRLRNTPGIVFGGPSDLTRKTMEDSNRYNQQAIVDFLKRFGGPIESVMRRVKPYGLDTSRLQRHVAELNSIQMMRLIANDVNDLADQLDHGNLVSSNGRAQRAHCSSYYFNCP